MMAYWAMFGGFGPYLLHTCRVQVRMVLDHPVYLQQGPRGDLYFVVQYLRAGSWVLFMSGSGQVGSMYTT